MNIGNHGSTYFSIIDRLKQNRYSRLDSYFVVMASYQNSYAPFMGSKMEAKFLSGSLGRRYSDRG